VLRAKYYPNGNLIDTVFTGNASSTWQAIEYGLELLKKGIIWRIGNGTAVRIWRDPWIPRHDFYRTISPKRRCRLKWVSDLLNPDGSWNTNLLHTYFEPIDITEILKIKTSRRNDADFVAWGPDEKGLFSVKGAYKLGMECQERDRDEGATSSRPDGANKEWKLIWQNAAPPKVKTFTWKLARNGLATQVNLRRRKIDAQPTCRICGREDEDTFHALVTCPQAKGLWRCMRQCWDLPADEMLQNTGKDWVLQLLAKLNAVQRLMVMMILWRVWHVHNELTHDKPAPPMAASKRFLCSYVDVLLFIKQHPTADACKGKQVISYSERVQRRTAPGHVPKPVKQWERPRRGRLKLNVDGSYIAGTGDAGAGMILRGENGEVIFAACRYLTNCASALEAEVAACEEGLKLALNWSSEPIDVEMDCSVAVNMVLSTEMNRSSLVHLIKSIKDALRERDTKIMKIAREQNAAGHVMAKLGREDKTTQFWLRSFPPVLSDIVQQECNSVIV
jgi:ribonuclease HI